MPPSIPVLVPNSITDDDSPTVMSPQCPLPPEPPSPPQKNMQATSHRQPVDLPVGSDHPRSAFIEEVNNEDLPILSAGPQLIIHATIQHVDNLDFIDSPGLTSSQVPP